MDRGLKNGGVCIWIIKSFLRLLYCFVRILSRYAMSTKMAPIFSFETARVEVVRYSVDFVPDWNFLGPVFLLTAYIVRTYNIGVT